MLDGVNHDRLVKFIARMVGPADAEDIVQSTYLKILGGAATYTPRPDATYATWVTTIAKRLAIDWLRRERRRVDVEVNSLDDPFYESYDNVERDDTNQARARDVVIRRHDALLGRGTDQDQLIALRRAIASLSEEDRRLLSVFNETGSHRAVQDATGLSAAAVNYRLRRARRRLKELLS